MIGAPLTRREALRLFAAQMTLALASCSKPDREIVPYVRKPEGLVPGEPLRFATTLPLSGYGQGIIGISVDGRPIKIEGNPAHPASLGATSPFLEASVLSLYDPDRSRTVTKDGNIASWEALRNALTQQMAGHRTDAGEGLRLLTGRVTSPTLLRQIGRLLAQFPKAAWHTYEPADSAAERNAAQLAYGRPVETLPRLDEARIVLSLDADPLGPGPDQIRNARQWSLLRDPSRAEDFSRYYAAMSHSTLTAMKADQHLVAHPNIIANMAIALASRLGAALPDPSLPSDASGFVASAADDLLAHRGQALVLAGRTQTPETHALVHWINARLQAPQTHIAPVDGISAHQAKGLAELIEELNAGQIETLLILDTNPVYHAATAMKAADAIRKARFALHQSQYTDETAAACHWHVPLSHPLESWSDLRARDGTASIVQPLINPLYGTITTHELLAFAAGQTDAHAYDLVREIWRRAAGNDFETWWRTALHDGVIAGSAAESISLAEPRLPGVKPMPAPTGMALVLSPDPSVWDGRYANNPWLQECPKPIGKEVWGNALGIGPQDASRLGLADGDLVAITAEERSIETPVRIDSSVAAGVVAMSIGYGRWRAGKIGGGIGINAGLMQSPSEAWLIPAVSIVRTGASKPVLTTQNDVKLEGHTRELYRMAPLSGNGSHQQAPESPPSELPTLLPGYVYDTYAWGMVIDTSVCIGCNACVVACQAENNVPVVGPEEISRGRDMHWLRVDTYLQEAESQPTGGFQPIPCMHCEHAPCEPVCPVAASVHDGEGLNAQVYNRCIGTRFCEANCPYKVRRFNFFGYADGQEYANLGSESIKAQRNPEVTVRQRGVMEKCTYCVQRISRARIDAERAGQRIPADAVVTACQSACPTRAITFGDINNPASAVTRNKGKPHNYALLGHLGTRPRTTYLADIRNPHSGSDGERG